MKLVITEFKYKNKDFWGQFLLNDDGRVVEIYVENKSSDRINIGDIYIGRVDKCLKNGAFLVNIGDGREVYLDTNGKAAIYFKKYSKKESLCQGDELFVEIKADSVRDKDPLCKVPDNLDPEKYEKAVLFDKVKKGIPNYIKTINSFDIKDIVSDIPSVCENIKSAGFSCEIYKDDFSLIKLYSLGAAVDSALQKKISLKSGANIIFDSTEAMYVIDVNSSKSNKSIKKSDNYKLEINLEAAKEICHQLRLRNLSGMILIDFINMDDKADYEILIDNMKKLLKNDPIECHYIDMTGLGIMEITRKKVQTSLKQLLTGRI